MMTLQNNNVSNAMKNTIQQIITAVGALAIMAAGAADVAAQPGVTQGLPQQSARPSSSLQLGLYGGGLLSTPSVSFTNFPGVLSCNTETYNHGSGGGFAVAGVLSLVPPHTASFTGHLGGTLKVGLVASTTTFEVDETLGMVSDQSGDLHPAVSRYGIDASVSELRLEPTASYWLSQKTPLVFSVGARLGFELGATYDYAERLVSPAGATFNGSAERGATNGDLEEKNAIQAGVLLGLGYDLSLSPTITLRPELTGVMSLTSPVKSVDWKAHEVRFGVSVLYTLPRTQSSPLQDE